MYVTVYPPTPPPTSSCFILQFLEDFNLVTFHVLYNGTSLLADVGGYLGLFLGLSIFGLFELAEKAVAVVAAKKEGPANKVSQRRKMGLKN